jgi:adenine-specific DNA-methyltransferase
MTTVLRNIDTLRTQRITSVEDSHKSSLGQYLTPAGIAEFMASLLEKYGSKDETITMLDPGAGLGVLFSSFLEKKCAASFQGSVDIDAYEIDGTILPQLETVVKGFSALPNVHMQIIQKDFIKTTTYEICVGSNKTYSHIIMNPPYKKINSTSDYRHCLRDIGVETVNLYSAFLAVSICLLTPGGVVVAIIPRSFCNGLYFLPFRKFLLSHTELMHIHTFHSRKDAFKEESVLQENVIIVLRKGSKQASTVWISSSGGKHFEDFSEKSVQFRDVVKPDDEQYYIAIPTSVNNGKNGYTFFTLYKELGIEISTGPIVDFRMKEKLIANISDDSIPLLYPVHFKDGSFKWPVQSKKPNSIILTGLEKEKIAFQKGTYVLVKRFSSKEEKRRIQASFITEDDIDTAYFAVENHLNIIHTTKNGLDKNIAGGLFVFLNTQYFDDAFREFSGHTQVNATDLRNMKYPTREQLMKMGIKLFGNPQADNELIFKEVMNEYV